MPTTRRIPWTRPGPFPRVGLLGGGLLAAGLLTGCAVGNQSGELQVPAVVSGLVTAAASCPAGSPNCSDVVATVAGAVVQAVGKDGTHDAVTDASGHYQIALLQGEWTLVARHSGTSTQVGPPRRELLTAGSTVVVNLQAGP